jgi:hypothetical protein
MLIIAPLPDSTLTIMLDTNPRERFTMFSQRHLAAVLLCGTALYAGSAQAGWIATPPIGGAIGAKCLLNDADCFTTSYTLGDKTLTLISRSTLVAANDDVVEYTLDPANLNTPWNLSLNFNPNRNNILNDTGNLRYKIAITDPSKIFDQVT